MELTPCQTIVAKDNTRFRVLAFGRGTGKTTLALEEGIACAVAKDKRRVAYFATTIQQARDIAWKRLKERVAPIMLSANEARLEVTIRTQDGGASEIVLRGWEAIETARGQEFDFIILDEVAFMRDFWNGWEKVLRPTLRISEGGAMFISTPNGFNHFHKLYKMGEDDSLTDYKSFHATSYDNPHVSHEEIESAKRSLPEDSFSQEYLADFRRVTGLVYKEFDPTRHVLDSLPERILVAGDKKILNRAVVERRGCLDFGFKNPAAMYTVLKDGEGIYYITDEFYESGKLHEELAELAASRGIQEWYPDPADAEGCAHLRRKGLLVKEVSKDIHAGIQTVQSLFKQNRLFIVNCPNLEFELNQYRYRDKGHSKVDLSEPELPIKENDHACFTGDTLIDGKRIDTIGVPTGLRDVFEYQLGFTTVKATPEHPVITNRGLVPIDTLRYDDVIWQNKLFMTVSNGIDTQSLKLGLTKTTGVALKRALEASSRDYIDTYGQNTTAPSLKDMIYITLMATPSITRLIILSVLTALNTSVHIGLMKSASGLEKILRTPLKKHQNGLKLQKDKQEEKKWVEKTSTFCTTYPWLKRLVTFATKNTKPNTQTVQDGVTTTVKPLRYVGLENVWALKTKSGTYRANGTLVSNCDAIRYTLHMWETVGKADSSLDDYYSTLPVSKAGAFRA